jgi:quinol monooxygenase YgiN
VQNESVRVVARIVAKRGAVEKLGALLRGLVAPTRQEPGKEDPSDFTFVEEWKSGADLDAHSRSPHVQQARSVLGDLAAAPPDIRRTRVIA